MIKALIFDYYDVMVDDIYWHAVVERAKSADKWGELQAIQSGLNSGTLGWNLFCIKVGELMDVSPEVVAHEYQNIPLNTELVDAIKAYKKRYSVALLSNADRSQLEPQLKDRNIDTLFDYIGISSDFKLMKPQPELFKRFVASMSLVPEQCVMIDDNPDNVAGAKEAGLLAIQFKTNEQLFAELEAIL
ncbi:MAG: HAD-IA family hydrolase [Candidatus Saccharimonadales bacterium]